MCWNLSKTKIFFCYYQYKRTNYFQLQKIIIFLPESKFWNKKSELESNPIPYLEQKFLSGSAFLVNLAAQNKQSFRLKPCLKQLPLNSTLITELFICLSFGEWLWFAIIIGGLIYLFNNPLESHFTTASGRPAGVLKDK